MAGSFSHVIGGWDLIENLGDAYEATEEMLWLILHNISIERAEVQLRDEFRPMKSGYKKHDKAFTETMQIMEKGND